MTRQTIGHYEILEKLGEGGMGTVYRARNTKLDRLVALKFPTLPLDSDSTLQRFQREARAISALNHPHIATIYDVTEHEGKRFLVLEYLPGGTLRSRLRSLREAGLKLSPSEVTELALQITDGLAHAHRQGVIHRDVKSDNVMFTAEGTVKVTDFSMAKRDDGLEITRTGSLAGTVSYMSPEQAQGKEADHRSDIFSLGVILFEMATGERPFRGPHEAVVLHDIVNAPTPPLRELRPDAPEAFEKIVHRAMAKEPGGRCQRLEEMLRDLLALREKTAAGASRRIFDSTAPTVPFPPAQGNAEFFGRRPNRRRLRWLALGGAALLLAGFVGVRTLRKPIQSWLARLPAEKQLVVLPFANTGGDAASQAFSDGLVEMLTTKLTQIGPFVRASSQGSLQVVPMTEVRKEGITSAGEAKRLFGIGLALSGSVQHVGSNIVVTVNLIDAGTRRQIASRFAETRVDEMHTLQDSIFSEAAVMLEVRMEPAALKLVTAGQTRLSTAYDLYLKGLGKLARYDQQANIDFALVYFQQALQQDPQYGLAHAGLGETFWQNISRPRTRNGSRRRARVAPAPWR